jgi:hypothetical protein
MTEPLLKGPLIRPRYPIEALIHEFSNADPAFLIKTTASHQKLLTFCVISNP